MESADVGLVVMVMVREVELVGGRAEEEEVSGAMVILASEGRDVLLDDIKVTELVELPDAD